MPSYPSPLAQPADLDCWAIKRTRLRPRTCPINHRAALAGYLSFLLLGVDGGAVYGALNLGLVLVYRRPGR